MHRWHGVRHVLTMTQVNSPFRPFSYDIANYETMLGRFRTVFGRRTWGTDVAPTRRCFAGVASASMGTSSDRGTESSGPLAGWIMRWTAPIAATQCS